MDKVSNKDLWERTSKPSSNRDRNSQVKMGMAGPHIKKAKHQRYETGLDVEPPGQAKEGETKTHLAARSCAWPMLQDEPRA